MPDFHEPQNEPTKAERLQFYKDELFREGIIKDIENQRIQTRLDRLVTPGPQWNRPKEVKATRTK